MYDNRLEKIAQRRKLLTKMWHSPHAALRNVRRKIDSMYDEEVALLEEVDNEIRDESSTSIKDLLKSLKVNNKAHRWLAVLDTAAQINFVAKKIVQIGDSLRHDRTEKIKDFYFSPEDSSGDEIDLSNIYSIVSKEAAFNEELIKEAFFKELGFGRGGTHRLLSRLFDTKMKEVKLKMNALTNKAEALGNAILRAYDELDKHRVRGDVGAYISVINQLEKAQKNFESFYINVYEAVKDYIPKKEEKPTPEPEKKAPEKVKEIDLPEIIEPIEEPVAEFEQELPVVPDLTPAREVVIPQPPEHVMQVREEDIEYEDEQQKVARLYLNRIKAAISNGESGVAAALLSKYSQYLEDNGNINGSVKALVMAQEILNG